MAASIAAVVVAGCGGETKTVTQTAPADSSPPTPMAPPPPALPALATRPKGPGEIVVKGEGPHSFGPYRFTSGIYRARFEQYAPEDPTVDFRNASSSIVAQLHRKPQVVDAETVHLFNATAKAGTTRVTVPGGRFYVDVDSADHSYVLRLTPL